MSLFENVNIIETWQHWFVNERLKCDQRPRLPPDLCGGGIGDPCPIENSIL